MRPPHFRIHVNDSSLVTRDYGYWVENELRERFDLEGVPVDDRLREARMRIVVVSVSARGDSVLAPPPDGSR